MKKLEQIEKKIKRITKEAKRLVRTKEYKPVQPFRSSNHDESKCISCLAAQARGNDDDKDNQTSIDDGDFAMRTARDLLSKDKNFKDWTVS